MPSAFLWEYVPLIAIFWNMMPCSQSKSRPIWRTGCFLNMSPWQKTEKQHQFVQGKVFAKAWKSVHIGFWLCRSQCTVLELCVTSTFSVIMVLLHFLWEGQDIEFWNKVWGYNVTQGGLQHMSIPFKPEMCTTEAILNPALPVNINKMWNFCLKLWFFMNCLLQRLETCSIRFGMPQTLNMHHSSHFDAFFPVKIKTMWNFGFFLNSPWQNLKKHQFAQGKSVCKGLQICTFRFLGMPITMHYFRTLCDKYFLSYYGSSTFFMGRSRYRVLKQGVGVKWDPRRTAAYVHSIFMVLNLIFYYVSPKIVIFHELLIVETGNKCHWIRHASNPKCAPLKQFWSIFASQNEQNVKFLSEIMIFQELLIAETWNLQH